MSRSASASTAGKTVCVKASENSPVLAEAVTPWRERLDLLVRGRAAVSVDEAAVILGLGRKTAWKAVKDKSLRTFRVGRRVLVPVGWLERTLAGMCEDDE